MLTVLNSMRDSRYALLALLLLYMLYFRMRDSRYALQLYFRSTMLYLLYFRSTCMPKTILTSSALRLAVLYFLLHATRHAFTTASASIYVSSYSYIFFFW